LCAGSGGELLVQHAQLRVVLVDDAAYPGFCRVIWNAHVREMSELSPDQRVLMMNAVFIAESAVRQVMTPHKIKLASLGNMTPHLHWHLIPRYADDVHFPDPGWAPVRRDQDPVALARRGAQLPELR